VYRVQAPDQATYLLKVRKGPVDPLSLAVPRALQEAGVTSVVAPIALAGQDRLAGAIGDYSLVLYPFVDGSTAMARGLADDQWVDYGAILRTVHEMRLPDALLQRLPRETFVSAWAEGVRHLPERIERRADGDPFVRALATIWQDHRDQIACILDQTDGYGHQSRDCSRELVLCHTDPHLNNVLVDGRGRLFLIDWDAPRLAPKERDLHFVIASAIGSRPIGSREEELILQGYGSAPIDWVALRYFRYEWLCGDLLEYAEAVLGTREGGDATKTDAIGQTQQMFAPGRAVASVRELERRASLQP
jgi:spectinomycin phosphotransferase